MENADKQNSEWAMEYIYMCNAEQRLLKYTYPYRILLRNKAASNWCSLWYGTELVDSSCHKWSPVSDSFFSNLCCIIMTGVDCSFVTRWSCGLQVPVDNCGDDDWWEWWLTRHGWEAFETTTTSCRCENRACTHPSSTSIRHPWCNPSWRQIVAIYM